VHVPASEDRPWAGSYAPGVPLDIDVPEESLVDLLDGAVARFGDRVALDFFGADTTYTRLGDEVARGAEVLRRLGVQAGDRVALVLPNCPQHVVAFYAALRLGAVVVEHNPLYTADEISVQLGDHRPRVIVAWDKVATLMRQLAAQVGAEHVLAVDLTAALPTAKRWALRLPVPQARRTRAAMTARARGVPSWDRLVAATPRLDPAHPGPGPTDVALLQYTGGTTGTPKAAVLTHRNLRANAAQGRAWMPGLADGEEVVYGVLPLFHAYGLTLCLTFTLSIGATLVLFPRFDVDMLLDAVRRRPPTFLPAVPPIYERLATAARDRGIDLSSVRYAISGAMSLPAATAELWESVTGGIIVEGYGMTETSPVALGNPAAPTRRTGSIGVPFPSTEVRVVDQDDHTHVVPHGEPGELLLRGPQVFAGYWNRPEESAQVVLGDGWIRTGDVVVMDDDGFFTIVDRIKELIITGGFNVYPSEVEKALRLVPGVEDAAVVGLPSAEAGEEVVAAIVPEAGVDIDEEAVRAAVREHLTPYKVPRRVFVVDDLPRSMIGKVLRREVRDRLLQSAGEGPT
jgi:long-chain acyl-CoA synthetase